MNQLRSFLSERNMTQTELAERLDFRSSYISMIISGKRPLTDTFRWRFMQAFGADPANSVLEQSEPAE